MYASSCLTMERIVPKLSVSTVLVILFSTSSALQCYECHGLFQPELCTNVVSCNQTAGQTACFVEEVMDAHKNFGYYMGCTANWECGHTVLASHLLGRRGSYEDGPGTRSVALTTCFKCCHGDLCNNVYCNDLCENNPCQHGATCNSTRLGDSFSCSCPPGYTGDRCQVDVDECASSPCLNGGSCEDRGNGFLCHCPLRITGPRCETAVTTELICSHCEGQTAAECNRTVICSHGEQCFGDTYVFGGKMLVRKGCRTTDFCKIYENVVHGGGKTLRQALGHEVTKCSKCCSSDLCNLDYCNANEKSCAAYLADGQTKSGVYLLVPDDGLPGFQVFCDMDTQGGGWTVFQRRQDGSVDFYRGWQDYKTGFGDVTGEFWLGLDKISRLTASGMTKLRVELEPFHHNRTFANYSYFFVAPESDNYRLNISGYSGTAGDTMFYHNGYVFSTKDRDHDFRSSENCAVRYKGAWWYYQCYESNLNGEYKSDGKSPNSDGITWIFLGGELVSMKAVEMKLK